MMLLCGGTAAGFMNGAAVSRGRRPFRVYVGTETGKMPAKFYGIHPPSAGLYSFAVNPITGAAAPPVVAARAQSPWTVTAGAGGRFIYTHEMNQAPDTGEGRVVAYAASRSALVELNSVSSGGLGAAPLTITPSGKYLLTCSFLTGSVVAIEIKADGSLGQRTDATPRTYMPNLGDLNSIKPAPPECTGVARIEADQCVTKPHEVVLSPGEGFALVPEINTGSVAVYRFDEERGDLQLENLCGKMPYGCAPRHLAFGKSGRMAYTSNERGSSVSAWSWDEALAQLTVKQTLPSAPIDFVGNTQFEAAPVLGDHKNFPADIVVHPSGLYLWVSNRGHPSIACFRIDPWTGLLKFHNYTMTGSLQCWSIDIDRSGEWLVAALQSIDMVAIFRIDPNDGALTEVSRVTVPFPTSVKIVNALV